MESLDVVGVVLCSIAVLVGVSVFLIGGLGLFDAYAYVAEEVVPEHKRFARVFGLLVIILGIVSLFSWAVGVITWVIICLAFVIFD